MMISLIVGMAFLLQSMILGGIATLISFYLFDTLITTEWFFDWLLWSVLAVCFLLAKMMFDSE